MATTTRTIRLSTLGALRLLADGAELDAVTAQPRRVALLVYLTLAEPRGLRTRDQLLALFWPEYDEQRGRNALSQAVHFLRRSLGPEALVSAADDRLRIDPDLVWCDVVAFEESLRAGHVEDALALYRGPFLDGFHVPAGAPELEQWIDTERQRLALLYARGLEQVAREKEDVGDRDAAVLWRRKLAAQDPLSARAALALMRSLVDAGQPEKALQHARIYETLVRDELQSVPDPEITAFVKALQEGKIRPPSNGSAPPAVESTASAKNAPAPPRAETPPEESDGSPPRERRRRHVGVAALGVLGVALAIVAVTRPRAPRLDCVAVLPFENISGDSSLEYFADALTGATITAVGRNERPESRARSSVLSFKHTRKPLGEIGQALKCDGIVEGSLTRQGSVVHVDVEALYAPEDRHLWAESFESDTSLLLPLERRVQDAVAERVLRLAGVRTPSTGAPHDVNPQVYRLYLRGRDAFRSRNPTSLRTALLLFKEAIARDPKFAAAYAGLADTYGFIGGNGYGSLAYLDSAARTAELALRIDSTASDAHVSMATTLTSRGEWQRAETEFGRAIALDHGNSLAHHWYAILLTILGRKDDAVQEIRHAVQIDPMSQAAAGARLEIEFWAGIKQPLGNPGSVRGMVDPTHPGTHVGRGIQLARRHKCPEAYEANKTADSLAPNNTLVMIGLIAVDLLCGKTREAHALRTEVERRPDAPLMAEYIAPLYAFEHNADSAFAWLDRTHWTMQAYYELRVNRYLDPLRGDPRFGQLLQRLRMP